jgi:hypothetical protein
MMNWKGFGRKRTWPNFEILYKHSPDVLRIITENLIQDSWYLDRDLNPRPLEYEAGVLTTRPLRSVRILYYQYILL